MSGHPDADLIQLGKQFEVARLAARKLEPEKRRLFDEYERAATDRRMPLNGASQPLRKLMEEVGYRQAYDAFTGQHHRAVVLMKAIHRHAAPSTIEGIAVKLSAVVFDQSDFAVDPDNWTTDVAEAQLLKLSRQVTKLARSTS